MYIVHSESKWCEAVSLEGSQKLIGYILTLDMITLGLLHDDVTKHAARNVKWSYVITIKIEFLLRNRYIKNKLSIQNLFWSIVSRLVDISRSYASHLTLHGSCDTLICKYPLDVIQCADQVTVVIMCMYCNSVMCLIIGSRTTEGLSRRRGEEITGWSCQESASSSKSIGARLFKGSLA